MMRAIGMVVVAAALLGGTARAAVIQPGPGVAAVEARVYSHSGTFTGTGGAGTPTIDQPNYNPKAYVDPVYAASSGRSVTYTGTNVVGLAAQGQAIADLASGQLHVTATSFRSGTGTRSPQWADVSGAATLSDVLTITGAITTPVVVRISMIVDGSFGGTNPTETANGNAVFALQANSPYAEVFLNHLNGGSVQEQDTSSYGGRSILDGGNATSLHFTLYDDVTITDTQRTINILATAETNLLGPNGDGSETADFGNTARLAVSLPTGLAFTSRSGVFLTQPQDVDPVDLPEPASVLALAVGLAATHAARRRRAG